MNASLAALVVIAGMTVATYLTRVSGYWLMSRVTLTRRTEVWLRQLPGAILISIAVPAVARGGLPELIAALATVGVALRVRNLFLAMAVGVLVVWLLRQFV